MPKWITAIFVFFLSTTLLTAKAITVEDVISKHVQAMAADAGIADAESETFSYYIDKGHKATLEGVEAVDGADCYKVSIDLSQGEKLYYLIDAKSWYIIRRIASTGNPSHEAREVDKKEIERTE